MPRRRGEPGPSGTRRSRRSSSSRAGIARDAAARAVAERSSVARLGEHAGARDRSTASRCTASSSDRRRRSWPAWRSALRHPTRPGGRSWRQREPAGSSGERARGPRRCAAAGRNVQHQRRLGGRVLERATGRRPRPAARRSSASESVPPSSSRTSASTIDRPVPAARAVDPGAVVGDRQHDVAVPLRELDPHRVAAVLERVLEQLARRRAPAPSRGRPPATTGSSDGCDLLPAAEPLDEHRAQPLEQLAEVDALVAPLGQHLVHGGDREDPVDRVVERAPRRRRASPRACSRSSDATVCRLFLTRWWISWASTPRITARPCSSATAAWCAIDASSARSSSVNGVSRSATSSPICAALPAQRRPHRVLAGAALRPRDLAVLEHERRAGRRRRRPSSS